MTDKYVLRFRFFCSSKNFINIMVKIQSLRREFFMGSRFAGATRREAEFWFRKNSGRSNPPENNGSGNGVKNRRAAAIWEERNGRAKNGKFQARDDFDPGHRNGRRGGAGGSLHLAVRDGHHRAVVVIVGNRPAVQPGVQRRTQFRRRHEQPDGERQDRRRRVQAAPPPTADGIYQLQIVCKIAGIVPDASGK
jgi:hypothetical protein